jgi:hypothetical protein
MPGFHVPEEDAGMVADWTISHFSHSSPEGKAAVSALLRRVADSIESLGDVEVEGITFTRSPTDAEDNLTLTVYYYRQPRRR